jgi:hypothetical protein
MFEKYFPMTKFKTSLLKVVESFSKISLITEKLIRKDFFYRCTPIESLLQSTIECLYNYSCVDDLAVYLNTTLQSPTPLDKNQTRFSPNDTVDSIVQQMFIETCSLNVSYQQFFNECRPLSCSVTLTERNSFIIVFTTLVGLYGGLTTFLRFMVPTLLIWIFKFVALCKRRGAQIQVEPVVSNEH